jgi:hypothetical protein
MDGFGATAAQPPHSDRFGKRAYRSSSLVTSFWDLLEQVRERGFTSGR